MSRGRILVIEDEAIVADDIVYCLEEAGYEVPAVCSAGENALEFLDTNTADLALVDILLDGEMDGIETARRLRNRNPLPIIYLTSFTNPTMLERAKETQPSGYIVKPFKRRELLATLEMALHHGQPAPGTQATPTQQQGRMLAQVWQAWMQVAQEPSATPNGNFATLQTSLQKILATPFTSVSHLDDFLPFLEALFQTLCPNANYRIYRELEAELVPCAPLMLAELLLWPLQVSHLSEPEAALRLDAGILQTTEANAAFLNLSPGSHSKFRISLPRSSSVLDQRLFGDHQPMLAYFQWTVRTLQGDVVILRDENGVSGILVALPLTETPRDAGNLD